MITLYYHRGACSTSNHFALEDAGVLYEAVEVDLSNRAHPLTQRVRDLNPMAMTPVLVLDNGAVITQNAATLAFIADMSPEKRLLPSPGTIERAQADSWLSFVASDLHPTMIEYIYKGVAGDESGETAIRNLYESRVARRLTVLETHLASSQFILGDNYSVIDGYLLIVLCWSEPANISLVQYPNIVDYMKKLESRPTIKKVREIEGVVAW
jgi:glutathione S-transferase